MNKTVTITKHGNSDVLKVVEHPVREPEAQEVRIAVHAAGLNFADVSARQGLYPAAPKPPCVVGYEVSGVVDLLGPGVTNLKLGDRVLALTQFGGQASSIVVPAEQCFKMPDEMSFVVGAAIPVNYLTAHHMLFHVGTVHPASSILVHMAAGGVGTAALQLLSTVPDLEIYGTASAPKHDYLRSLGCTQPIDYRTQDYEEVVRNHTQGRGVDIVLDPLGGQDWKKSWRLLAPAGRMVAFGFSNGHSGPSRNLLRVVSQLIKMPFINPIKAMQENRSIQGVDMGGMWSEVRVLRVQIERIMDLWHQGIVKPHIHGVVPYSEASEAHLMLEERKNRGKVVLVPDHIGPDEYSN